MSRIGTKPIPVPSGVKVAIRDRTVSVEGPKGKLTWTHRPEVAVTLDGDQVTVTRASDDRQCRALHGLTRSLVANMVQGCHEGFRKALEVYGVGYGLQVQGNKLTLQAGLSHPVVFEVPAGLTVEVQVPQARGDTEPAKMTVFGADKQMVGEFAARVRRARPPEPYKGKGVRYADERVRRKVGKAFVGAGG